MGVSPDPVTYRGKDYRVARSTKAWVWLIPVGESPSSENTVRISAYVYNGLVAQQKPSPNKRGPMDDDRWRKAHRTGKRRADG